MKSNRIAFAVISLLVLLALTPVAFRFNWAAAQADASSSTTTDQSATQSTADQATTSTATTTSQTPSEPMASQTIALTLVHTAGTKYVDFCTDGTKLTAYPGDPAVDSHFTEINAPSPKCPNGLKWHHTETMPGYDTSSGNLEVGEYAQQANGTFVVHYPAMTYTDATSTEQWPDRVTEMPTDPSTTPLPAGVSVTATSN